MRTGNESAGTEAASPNEQRGLRPRRLTQAVEIAADVETAFSAWSAIEELPDILSGVRRVKQIGGNRSLWDADVNGRQLVWEARVRAFERDERIAWESTWGARHRGEVRFEECTPGRTRLTVEIEYWPRGPWQKIGAALGLVRDQVRCDLARFARAVERARLDRARDPRRRLRPHSPHPERA